MAWGGGEGQGGGSRVPAQQGLQGAQQGSFRRLQPPPPPSIPPANKPSGLSEGIATNSRWRLGCRALMGSHGSEQSLKLRRGVVNSYFWQREYLGNQSIRAAALSAGGSRGGGEA